MSKIFLALAAILTSSLAFASAPDLIPADGSCWKTFAPRPGNAPASEMIKQRDGYRLTLASGGKAHAYGGWTCHIEGLEPGRHYRFRADVAASGFSGSEQ